MKILNRKTLASALITLVVTCLAQTAKAATVLAGHTYWVKACAWSPDETQIVSGAYDGTVRVWDANSGKPVRIFELADNQGVVAFAFSATFSSDGKQIIAATTNGVMIWNLNDGKLVRQIGNQMTPYPLAVSTIAKTKNWVVFYQDRTIERWSSTDAGAPEIKTQIQEEDRMPYPANFSFSADSSKMLLTTGDNNSLVLDPLSLQTIHSFSGASYWGGALSPDGKKALMGSMARQPVLVDVASGAVLSREGKFSSYISMNAWSSKSQISTGDGEGLVRTQNSDQTGHTDTIGCMSYSSSGRLVTGSHDGTLRIW